MKILMFAIVLLFGSIAHADHHNRIDVYHSWAEWDAAIDGRAEPLSYEGFVPPRFPQWVEPSNPVYRDFTQTSSSSWWFNQEMMSFGATFDYPGELVIQFDDVMSEPFTVLDDEFIAWVPQMGFRDVLVRRVGERIPQVGGIRMANIGVEFWEAEIFLDRWRPDLNEDGMVNLPDVAMMQSDSFDRDNVVEMIESFGMQVEVPSPSASVPEPTTLWLIIIAGTVLLWYRRRSGRCSTI